MAEMEEMINRLSLQKGVQMAVVTNKEGNVLQSVGPPELVESTATLLPSLTDLACRAVRDLEPTNALEFLRLRCKKHEIMVAAGAQFNLIVIQELPAGEGGPHGGPRRASPTRS